MNEITQFGEMVLHFFIFLLVVPIQLDSNDINAVLCEVHCLKHLVLGTFHVQDPKVYVIYLEFVKNRVKTAAGKRCDLGGRTSVHAIALAIGTLGPKMINVDGIHKFHNAAHCSGIGRKIAWFNVMHLSLILAKRCIYIVCLIIGWAIDTKSSKIVRASLDMNCAPIELLLKDISGAEGNTIESARLDNETST